MPLDIQDELQEFVRNIGQRNMFYGNKIPDSIMKLIEVEVRPDGGGVLAPYWIGVLQRGRGPRRSKQSSGLSTRIYNWMEKRGLFTSTTPQGKLNEARRVTWYINKYGNKQFRNKVFVDIYETERQRTIEKIEQKVDRYLTQITADIL